MHVIWPEFRHQATVNAKKKCNMHNEKKNKD